MYMLVIYQFEYNLLLVQTIVKKLSYLSGFFSRLTFSPRAHSVNSSSQRRRKPPCAGKRGQWKNCPACYTFLTRLLVLSWPFYSTKTLSEISILIQNHSWLTKKSPLKYDFVMILKKCAQKNCIVKNTSKK